MERRHQQVLRANWQKKPQDHVDWKHAEKRFCTVATIQYSSLVSRGGPFELGSGGVSTSVTQTCLNVLAV